MADYHINVFWSEEDGCYVADIPDRFPLRIRRFPGVSPAPGPSGEGSMAGVGAGGSGIPFPEPRYRPAMHAG